MAGTITGLITLSGIGALFLGQRIKRGSQRAAGCAALMFCGLLAFTVLHLVRTKGEHGWYEMFLAFFLASDSLFALLIAHRLGAASHRG